MADSIANHPVVSRAEWLSARTALLAKEKEFTRLRDELARQRRALPWVKVGKEYVFEGRDGSARCRSSSGGAASSSSIISCSTRRGAKGARIAPSGPTTSTAGPSTSTIAT